MVISLNKKPILFGVDNKEQALKYCAIVAEEWK